MVKYYNDHWFPNPDTSPAVLVNADSEAMLTGLRYSTAWMTRVGSQSTNKLEASGWDSL